MVLLGNRSIFKAGTLNIKQYFLGTAELALMLAQKRITHKEYKRSMVELDKLYYRK